MKFCSQCGSELTRQIPEGDNRERSVCTSCDTIFYENPKVISGTIPVHEGKILLCKRAIEPRLGYWTLPGGFMENGETTEQAAIRETLEEANAVVEIQSLFAAISVTHISQVHLFFLADLPRAEYSAGDESLEVELFSEDEIPWDNLAFPTVEETLRRYFDNPTGEGKTLTLDIGSNRRIALD